MLVLHCSHLSCGCGGRRRGGFTKWWRPGSASFYGAVDVGVSLPAGSAPGSLRGSIHGSILGSLFGSLQAPFPGTTATEIMSHGPLRANYITHLNPNRNTHPFLTLFELLYCTFSPSTATNGNLQGCCKSLGLRSSCSD
jgi:hypothetical protein